MLDRKTASRTLRAIAQLTELHGGNPHRVRAFANAARSVERIEGDLAEMVASGDILNVQGIGKGTAAVLADLAGGREPEVLVELERATPPGVRELLEVAGLGPKRARTLWQELAVTSVGELEYACRENRLLGLSGFGAASQQRLLEAVRFHQSSRERRLVHQAWDAAQELTALARLLKIPVTVTLMGLGVRGSLLRTLRSTNPIENLQGALQKTCRNVKRWRGGAMIMRWGATALMEAEKKFRRIAGYKSMGLLIAALEAKVSVVDNQEAAA